MAIRNCPESVKITYRNGPLPMAESGPLEVFQEINFIRVTTRITRVKVNGFRLAAPKTSVNRISRLKFRSKNYGLTLPLLNVICPKVVIKDLSVQMDHVHIRQHRG